MGKPSPPPPPDYGPLIQQSTAAAQSDAEVAREQLAQQKIYAERSANLGDAYFQLAQDQRDFGAQQYADLKPFLQRYMESQQGFTDAAGQNLFDQMESAREARRQSTETYNRYMTDFAPRETQFAREAFDYATPARMDQAAAEARGDVATAFGAQRDAATRQLASYGIDPTQGRYAGVTQAMDISRAASEAAAGTMARKQTEQQGKQYELAGLQVGQKLPAQAIGQAGLGINAANAGLGGAAIGGSGITAANQSLYAGTVAMGSPTQYAQMSNPYTQLQGSYGSQAGGLFTNQIQAIGAAGNLTNTGFSNQMDVYRQQSANAMAPWQAVGTAAGIGAGLFLRSDRRLKEGVERVGWLDNGLAVYRFRYLGDSTPRIGLMADEVEQLHPEAVTTDAFGYKLVDYQVASHG